MFVIFKREGSDTEYATACFYEDKKRQADLMHRWDIDKQVRS